MRGMKSEEGNRTIRSDGYAIVYHPGWPSAWKSGKNKGWVMEHKYVIEKSIGRLLTRSDIVHHKNHDRSDNRIENLELMNRRSHARKHAEEAGKQIGKQLCSICGRETTYSTGNKRRINYCLDCFRKMSKKTEYPTIEQLIQDCKKYGYVSVGKKLGVSDNAVRKHIRKLGFNPPESDVSHRKSK